MNGFRGKVNAIVLMKQQMRLISSAEDAHLVFWKLDKQREPVSQIRLLTFDKQGCCNRELDLNPPE